MGVQLRKEVLLHMAHRVLTRLCLNYLRCNSVPDVFVGRGAHYDPFWFSAYMSVQFTLIEFGQYKQTDQNNAKG